MSRSVATATALACALALACAPRAETPAHVADAGRHMASEIECERAIAELDARIAACAADTSFAAAALVEARSLRAGAFESYLAEEYDLALELIDEALALLRNPS